MLHVDSSPPARTGPRVFRIVRRPPEAEGIVDLLWAASAVGVFAAALAWPALDSRIPLVCPFRSFTGIPCPTCGATRSIVDFVHGDFAAAFAHNPLIFLAACASAGAIVYALLARTGAVPRVSLALGPVGRAALRILLPAALAANWVYLLWAGTV